MILEDQARSADLPPAVAWACEECAKPFELELYINPEEEPARLFLQLVKLSRLYSSKISYRIVETQGRGRVLVHCDGQVTELASSVDSTTDVGDYVVELYRAGTPDVSLRNFFTKTAFRSRILESLHTVSRYMLRNQDIDTLHHIFLTGMTAGYGLGFNRAVLFTHEVLTGSLIGEKAIGSLTLEEARHIWEIIETEDQNIEDFILRYKKEDFYIDSSLLGVISDCAVQVASLNTESEFNRAMKINEAVVFRGEVRDPVLKRFNPGEEFILAPIISHQRLWGFVFADNAFNGRKLDEDIRTMTEIFTNQTALIWENIYMLQNLRKEARLDFLTGVANRNEMENILDYLFSIEKPDLRFFLLLMDIDNFKTINDQKGHAYGDRILVEYSRILKTVVRGNDFVARYGGDEFLIIIRDVNREKVSEIAERLLSETCRKLDETVSIGVASYPVDSRSRIELFEKADIALYRAKKAGRNRVVFYEES